MKKITVNLIFMLIFSIHINAFASEHIGEVEEVVLDSQILDEKRKLVVYLPATYKNDTDSFPVMYITDGDIQGGHTSGTLDFLAKFDQAPSMIVVGIVNPSHKRGKELTLANKENSDLESLSGADLFLTFVEKEVIPFIKARYRTLEYQALSGTSHGGQFAINALVKRPNLFNGVIAISPSLYWNNNELLGLAEEAMKGQELAGRLFISIADEEPTMTTPFQKFGELIKKYPNPNLNVSIKNFDDESHDSTTLLGQYYGIKHLFPNWAIPKTPQTLADLQSIFTARSELLNQPMVIPEDRANGYGQWLQYLNRKEDALALFKWNRDTYSQSFNAHKALIKSYLHFKLANKAKAALIEALKTLNKLDPKQKQELESLLA